VDALAEAKRKLELMGTREKEAGGKDAHIQQLEKDISALQAKVSRVEGGIGFDS
jgi:hypothetical protein